MILRCKNHPELRWSCKDIAAPNGKYNGIRNIFFNGKTTGEMYSDFSGVKCDVAKECDCSAGDLEMAPEQALTWVSFRDAHGQWQRMSREDAAILAPKGADLL